MKQEIVISYVDAGISHISPVACLERNNLQIFHEMTQRKCYAVSQPLRMAHYHRVAIYKDTLCHHRQFI